jgi:hypothetical protein
MKTATFGAMQPSGMLFLSYTRSKQQTPPAYGGFFSCSLALAAFGVEP